MVSKMDELLTALGSPGRFQLFVFVLSCLNFFPLVFNHVVMAFFGSTPKHTCHMFRNETHPSAELVTYMNQTVLGIENAKCSSTIYLANGVNQTKQCTRGHWHYEPLERETTIVMEWDLVCDDAYLSSLATTIYFCGVMVGGLLFGYLCDRFGRRPNMLATLYVPIAIGIGIFFVQHYAAFVVLRFIQGIFMQGIQISSYVLAMEYMVPKYRPIGGAVIEAFWGFAVLVLSGLAFLIRDWRYIQIAISVPAVLLVFYICIIPESLRWMITKGDKDEQTQSLLERITKFNKIDTPKQLYEEVKNGIATRAENGEQPRQFTLINLMQTPKLRKRSLILFYLWLAVSVGYYGLTFKITSLPGNKYLNFFIGASVEFAAYLIAIPVFKLFGRKKPLIVFASLGAITCITAGSLPADQPQLSTGFAIAGRFAMGGFFSVMFLYTSELYPTVTRNIGLGACAFFARLGGVLAPQINNLGRYTRSAVPIIVFGVLTFISAILAIFLPETHNLKLPDSIADVETNFRDADKDTAGEDGQGLRSEQTDLSPMETSKL